MKRILINIILFFAMFIPGSLTGEIYKWKDPEGQTHYSSVPPESGQSKRIELRLEPEVSRPPVVEKPKTAPSSTDKVETEAIVKKSLSFEELGDLPENEDSPLLETLSTGFRFDIRKHSAKYDLLVKSKSGLPFGAVLDIRFENPSDASEPILLTERRLGGANKIRIVSPPFFGLQCGNYQVDISIYRTTARTRLLGKHTQIVQSRINMKKIKNLSQFTDALEGGNCP